MKKDLTYEQALTQLEQIVSGVEHDGLDLAELSAKLKEAKELLSFCKAKLLKAEADIHKIMDDGEAQVG